MKTYIGTKIIQAEPALRVGGEIISRMTSCRKM